MYHILNLRIHSTSTSSLALYSYKNELILNLHKGSKTDKLSVIHIHLCHKAVNITLG